MNMGVKLHSNKWFERRKFVKVIDLLRERELIELKYFTGIHNPCVEDVDKEMSPTEKSQIINNLVMKYHMAEEQLKKYLELSDKLHESNARTYIEILGYPMTVQTALEVLARSGITANPLMYLPSAEKCHPLTWFREIGTFPDIVVDEHLERLDPMHLCEDVLNKANPLEELKMELSYAIKISNCITDV